MAKLDVINLDGQKVGDIDLDDSIFGIEVKEHLLWEVVKQQLASRRAGTHSTRTRTEARGGGKKPYRQKGTGRARQGSSRSPNHVGGGKVFAPRPRDYAYSVPKKVKQAALRCALSLRLSENNIVVLNSLELPEIKTKRMAAALKAIGAPSALVVDRPDNTNAEKSLRNLPHATFLGAEGLNVYDILDHKKLVLSQASVDLLQQRLTNKKAEGAP